MGCFCKNLSPKNLKFVKSFEKLQNNCTIFSMSALICIFTCKRCMQPRKVSSHDNFDSQNMGLEVIILQLSAELAKI